VIGIFCKKNLKILFVGAEAAPFVKIGGLSSVMKSLPKALNEIGHDARVMIPKYLSIDTEKYFLKMEHEGLEVPTGNSAEPDHLVCNVRRCDPIKEEGIVTTYFLENQEYYEKRANVYGYSDDPVRWALLCRGVLEFIKKNRNWVPDVIVCADWQSALIPNFLKTTYSNIPKLTKIATVFSIHNLYFQAMYDHRFVSEMDFDDGHSEIPGFDNPRLTKINWMRRGIMYADAINTVSPTYAKEIMTKNYGELLDELLRERRSVLSGILNGIDYDLWNPEKNPHVAFPYYARNLSARAKNKASLQGQFNLPIKKDAFIMAIVCRFTKQKGLDLLMPILDLILQELPAQLVIVGEGDSEYMHFFHNLETKYPDKVAVHLKFDSVLAHKIFAGADVVLVPSKFEPCGLVQLEAMRMGTIPIVRKTGGLADSVEDYSPEKQTGTGFVFEKFDSSSLMIAIIRAFENFRDRERWQELQKRAMSKDFSWESSAEKYVKLFLQAIAIHGPK